MTVRKLGSNGIGSVPEVIVEHGFESEGWGIGRYVVGPEVPKHDSTHGREDSGLIQMPEHTVNPVGRFGNVLQNEDGISPIRCKWSAKKMDEHR